MVRKFQEKLFQINFFCSLRFSELPRRQQFIPLLTASSMTRKGTISQFFNTTTCVTCDSQCQQKVCSSCREDPQKIVLELSERINDLERKVAQIKDICESCCKRSFETNCISLDCPVIYSLVKAKRDFKQVELYQEILDEF